MPKFLYFASRNVALSPEAFISRWRRHAGMTTARPSWKNMRFYLQADTLRPAPIAGASEAFDGFCLVESSPSFHAGPEEQPCLDRLAQDELEIFTCPIPPRLIVLEPEILLDGGAGVSACLVFDDADAAQGVAKRFAVRKGLKRIILNRVTGGSKDPVDCKAVVELCADDASALTRALDTVGEWREARFTLIAREHLLWDTREPARHAG